MDKGQRAESKELRECLNETGTKFKDCNEDEVEN